MIKVAVHSTEVRHFSGNSKATGKPFSMAFQEVWMFFVSDTGAPLPYPEKVEIVLPKDKDGAARYYPVGEYLLCPSSIQRDRRTGDVTVAPRLIAKPTAKAAA